MKMKSTWKIVDWSIRILAAFILLQTLFFKFTGAEESIFIFETVGMEPWGRIGTGIAELITAVLLLIPGTALYGALLAIGLMSGAIFFHLSKLGIVVHGDGGLLFGLAVTVVFCCVITVVLHRQQLPFKI